MTAHAIVSISDPRLRSLFALLLNDIGANVATCDELDDVQRVVTSRHCQLCIVERANPAEWGPVIAALRQLSPETKVLLLADREQTEQVFPYFSQGLTDALLQPINPRRALDALHRLLGADMTGKKPVERLDDPGHYQPRHVVARSKAMRAALAALSKGRQDPLGVVLTGEPGCEFELMAREFQAMNGDSTGYVVVLGHNDITSDGLATHCSLDRLNPGVSRTFFVPEVEKLPKAQQAQLIDYLRGVRKRREKEKPLRMVLALGEALEGGRGLDNLFVEELLFIMPCQVRMPPLRERREDIELLARQILMELTAIYPAYRARSFHPAALDWLSKRLWRGNHQEFCGVLRNTIMDCANREINVVHFGNLAEGGRGEEAPALRSLAERMILKAEAY